MEEIKYNITNHALERYAERMAGKKDPTDMRIYIKEHKSDIENRINKLINYGELIFEGKIKEYNSNQVFYKDRWVVIIDPKNKNVVTLYKIDLGDEEVNELFANKILEKIKQAQAALIPIKEEADRKIEEYRQVIDDNNHEIEYSKRMIRSLEETNSSYNILIKNANLEVDKQIKQISDLVETLIARKQF